MPSAAQPAVTGRGDVGYARTAAAAIRSALREFGDVEAVMDSVPNHGLTLSDPLVSARCAGAWEELPVLVCHFGPDASQPVAQALYWYDRDGWQMQLYPQASIQVAADRHEWLAETGCRLGCSTGIVRVRQAISPDGRPELLVVVNLGYTGSRQAEEPHLLQYDGLEWKLVWVPPGGDWNYGHAQVEFVAKGTTGFKVHSSSWLRNDPFGGYINEVEANVHREFAERWIRKGPAFVMADRREAPGPFSTLVRLIHYLSAGSDEKAMELLTSSVPLEDARQALAQKPPRQGWSVTRWGDRAFLLDTRKTGLPNLGVRFEQRGDDWLLAELWRPDSD